MLKEFYEYISKKIIQFFGENDANIVNGARYCFTLNSQDAVDGLEAVFCDYAKKHTQTGSWEYTPPNSSTSTYQTFTLDFHKNKIAIILKGQDMTEDFLATLRNCKTTMLMITAAPIDSILKGTDDLSSKGFPFHRDSIIADMHSNIQESSLSNTEKAILKFEIDRHSLDSNLGDSSIFEYQNVLSVINNNSIDHNSFSGFRLFYDETLDGLSPKELSKKIEENNKRFELIDKTIKYGDVEQDLDKYYEKNLIDKLTKSDAESWSSNITYNDIIKSSTLKENSKNNNLIFEECLVYNENPLNYKFYQDEAFYVSYDGTTAAKKRNLNILIFNKDKKRNITIELNFNRNIKSAEIITDDQYELDKNSIKVCVSHAQDTCTFHNVKIHDVNSSNSKYNIKICVVDIDVCYFQSITTAYTINLKKNKSAINIISNHNDIILNSAQSTTRVAEVKPNATFNCEFSHATRLRIADDIFMDNDHKISININVGQVVIPLIILDDTKKATELTPLKAFKLKNKNKSNFKRTGDNSFISGTTEYYLKAEFLKNINVEEYFIKNESFCLKVDELGEFFEESLILPNDIEYSYKELLKYYKAKDLVPSLTYLDSDLVKLANNYIECVKSYFNKIVPNQTLSNDIRNIVKLGTIQYLSDAQEICLTPLNPLVLYYQLMLNKENGIDCLNDEFLKKLSCSNLLPYIQNENKTLYRCIDFSHGNSLEWVYFAPVDNKKYKGSRHFISKLVNEKIKEYKSHFKFLFNDIDNKIFKINILDMGDCEEVLLGLIKFYANELKKESDIENLTEFTVNIYSSNENFNNFSLLSNINSLREFIEISDVKFSDEYNSSDIANLLTRKIKSYLKNSNDLVYDYAHITFYEMNSKSEIGCVNSNDINTGVMLNGLISGVPSVYYGEQYKTAFGLKHSPNNDFINFVSTYNSISLVSSTSNPYSDTNSLSTEVDKLSISYMEKVYKSSNWVTFIDPKVDLNFFKSEDINLLIIHYSDQYTSSSSYDAITVTRKSKQYQNIISEFFKSRNIVANKENITDLICMFNAINGDWLLKLIASNGQFPREKISILSAVKVALAYYYHENITWVPISLEEILRVSGAVGLSQNEGLLSAKNLNFKSGPTSDDILLVGVENIDDKLFVHLLPIEVKIGNTDAMIGKAKIQVEHTANELMELLSPDNDEIKNSLECKMIRNFIMQLVVISAEKLKLYKVCDYDNFDKIVVDYRQKLLNDEFTVSKRLNKQVKKGSIIAFNNAISQCKYDSESNYEIIQIPEQTAVKYLVEPISQVKRLIDEEIAFKFRLQNNYTQYAPVNQNVGVEQIAIPTETITESDVEVFEAPQCDNAITSNKYDVNEIIEKLMADMDLNKDLASDTITNEITVGTTVDGTTVDGTTVDGTTVDDAHETNINEIEVASLHEENTIIDEPIESFVEHGAFKTNGDDETGIKVLFGKDKTNGSDLFWEPNNTNKVLNINTGIIGTSGTGKTQFTSSLIAQIHKNQNRNVGNAPIGVLIFDYNEDYNRTKIDFTNEVETEVLPLYKLPYNPLSLSKPSNFKPLLPLHTANAFKDTIGKICQLGENQKATLLECIMQAYTLRGIDADNPDTWDNAPPTFNDVYKIYDNDDEIKKNDKLSAIMSKINNFKLFEDDNSKTKSLFDLLDHVVVVDLSGNDSDIQNLVLAITLDLFYAEMQAQGTSKLEGQYRQISKLILVDEADNFMSEGFPTLKKILKEGRKFGVGTILSTQFLKHFGNGEDSYSEYVFTWVVHQVPDLKESDIRFVFNTKAKSQEEDTLFNNVKQLEKHASIVKMGNNTTPFYINDQTFWELMLDKTNKD